MKTTQRIFLAIISLFSLAGTYSCQDAEGEQTGSEFIPDMAHSVAYEANVYTNYHLGSFFEEESVKSRRELAQPRLPVKGTIPRGYTGAVATDGTFETAAEAVSYTSSKMKNADEDGVTYPLNGSVPYHYPDTEDGRNLAIQQVRFNPFPITQDGIARGQELFTIYCAICHGDKGDGSGYLVRDNGGKYPAQPANFLLEDFVNSSNGRYYHAIMYGKNAMGSHADKLSYEERWQVIHYIRSLQAKSLKLKYNHEVNELNPEYGVPEADVHIEVETAPKEEVSQAVEDPATDGHGH
ncbi:MAG TPA: cytochrome c [Bacteroidetes bacterium]|nr:cytochrome c [Bacteroidota bacterium]